MRINETSDILYKTETMPKTVQNQQTENELAIDNEKKQEDGVSVQISQELLDMFREQVQSSDEAEDATKDLVKIMEIARRISNGDKVPPTDEKKLMEYNFKLYMAAKSAAMMNQNKKHKEYDSLFDEDEDGSVEEKLRELSGVSNTASVSQSAEVQAEAAPQEIETETT